MKAILSIALVGISFLVTAQVKLAAKAHLLFNTDSPSWKNIKNSAIGAYNESGKNNVGYNVGLSAKMNVASAAFIMPEAYYTSFKTQFDVPDSTVTLEANSDRIDVPLLVGYKLWGENLNFFLGPVASYNLAKESQFQDFKEHGTKEFTIGYQFGIQVQYQKLLVNARYDAAFTTDQRDFINNVTNETISYDSRPSLLMIGLGFEF